MGCKSCGGKSRNVVKRSYISTAPRVRVSYKRSQFKNGVRKATEPLNGNVVSDPRAGKIDPSTGQLLSTIEGKTASDFEETNG